MISAKEARQLTDNANQMGDWLAECEEEIVRVARERGSGVSFLFYLEVDWMDDVIQTLKCEGYSVEYKTVDSSVVGELVVRW